MKKALLGFVLTILGLLGVASLLTMDIPLPPEVEALLESMFTDQQIKLIILINPSIMVLVAILLGTILYDKAGLSVPVIEKMVGLREELDLLAILKQGVLGGLAAGILISILSLIFHPFLPIEYKELGESMEPSIAARFLYGGITEEILLRFGFMTFIVWLASKIFKGTKPLVYWLGISIAALLFALAHLPAVYSAVGSIPTTLLVFILIGNAIGGIIFGWLYWKKGLESAFLAHIFTHVVFLLAAPIMG